MKLYAESTMKKRSSIQFTDKDEKRSKQIIYVISEVFA